MTDPVDSDRSCGESCEDNYLLKNECKECTSDTHCTEPKHCGHETHNCTEDKEVGDSCTSDSNGNNECLSGLCSGGTCKCKLDTDCGDNRECHSNECYASFDITVYKETAENILGENAECNEPYFYNAASDGYLDCQRVVSVCVDNYPCQNGGLCTNTTSGVSCTCPSMYTGDRCQDISQCDASATVQNGNLGTCTEFLNNDQSCTPSCNIGYVGSGSRSCNSGTLVDTFECKALACNSGGNSKNIVCDGGTVSGSGTDCVCVCPAGKHLDSGTCIDCPPLTFKAVASADACSNKKPEGCLKQKGLYEGSSKTSDDSECVLCNTDTTGSSYQSDTSNTYNPTDGSRAACIAKKTWLDCTNLGDAECAQINCAEGYYLHPGDAQTEATCQPCLAGTFSLVSDQECTECPVGEYQASQAQGECTKCPVGKSGTASGSGGGSLTCTADSDCNGDTCIQGNCYIVKPDIGSGGTCDMIITEEECAALNPDNYFKFGDANGNPDNDFAPGCLKSGNAYRYNPKNATGVCGEYGYKCVCKKPAPAQEPTRVCDKYIDVADNTYCFEHTDLLEPTKEECQSAWDNSPITTHVGMYDLSEQPAEANTRVTYTRGCFFYGHEGYSWNTFMWNDYGNFNPDYPATNSWAKTQQSAGSPGKLCCRVVQTRRRLNEVRDSLDHCFDCEVGTYADVEGLAECKLCQAGSFQDVVGQASCKTLSECPASTLVSNENEANKEKSSQDRACHTCDLSSATIANGAYTNADCASGTDCPHTCDAHYTPNIAKCLEGNLTQGTCTDIDECPSVDCGMGTCDGSVPTPNTYNVGYSCTCHAGYSFDNNGLCTIPETNTIEFKSNLKRSYYRQGERTEMTDNSMELCQGDSYYLAMRNGTAQLSGPSIDTTINTIPKHILFLEGDYVIQNGQHIFNIHVEECGVVKAKALSVTKNIEEMKQDFIGVSRADVAKVDQNGDTLFFKLQFRNLREMIQKSNILIKHGGKPQKKNRAGETFASKVLNEASNEKDNKMLRKFFKTSTLGKRKKSLSEYNDISVVSALNAQSSEADYEAAEEAIANSINSADSTNNIHKTQVFVHRIESRRRRLLQDNRVDIFDDCNPNDADCECNGYLLNGECTLYSVCLEDEYIQVWGGDQDHTCAPKESCPLGKGVISEAIDATSTSDSIPTTCVVCDGVGTYSDQQMSTLYNVPALCDTDADCPNTCVDGECVLKETGDCVSDQQCLGYCGDDYKCREYVDHIDPNIYSTGCKQIYNCTSNEIELVAPSDSQNRQCQCKWGYGRTPVAYAPAQTADPHLNHNRACIDCGQHTLSGGRCTCPDNHFSKDLECHPCQGTSINTDHVDPLVSGDTEADCVCLAGTRVITEGASNTCVPCPDGYTSDKVSVLAQNICLEDPDKCKVNERVLYHECVNCPYGKYNKKGDVKSGPNTKCDDNLCLVNQRVSSNFNCVACPENTFTHGGDDPNNLFETSCCPYNTYETVPADVSFTTNTCVDDSSCGLTQKCLNGLCAIPVQRLCAPCGENKANIIQSMVDLQCCSDKSFSCRRLKVDKDLHCESC